jgi:glycosyltransferase involved in cell wall biosynthesis
MITLLIPTYKRQDLLLKAIESGRRQTYKNINILIRDNEASIHTENLVRDIIEIDSRVMYKQNKRNIGAHNNFRLLLSEVKTQFFSICSDDNYLEEDFYFNAMELFKKHPKAKFVVFRTRKINLSGDEISWEVDSNKNSTFPRLGLYNSIEGFGGYMNGDFPTIWDGYVFRKEVIDAIDFGEFSEVGYGADGQFIWHAAARFPFVVTNIVGANYTYHESTVTSTDVQAFDERWLYWFRQRFIRIADDSDVSDEIKLNILKYYQKRKQISKPNKVMIKRAFWLLYSNWKDHRTHKELSIELLKVKAFFSWPLVNFLIILDSLVRFFRLENLLCKFFIIKKNGRLLESHKHPHE